MSGPASIDVAFPRSQLVPPTSPWLSMCCAPPPRSWPRYRSDQEVTVICSGTDGRFALEDAYAAGRFVNLLPRPRSDSARAAERLAGAYPDPWGPLTEGAGGAALRSTGQASDIPACARESHSAIVPRAEPGPGDIAVVSAQVINRQSTMQIA